MTEGLRPPPGPKRAPARGRSAVVAAIGALLALAFAGLGIWQVERLQWKLDLIRRVDARVAAEPTAPPAPDAFDPVEDAYRRVAVNGRFANESETFVQAVTELGPGFWVVTPLLREDGPAILVNRGFVPADRRDPATRTAGLSDGPVSVTGLLRPSEPGGGFLRANDARGDRWFSRDVDGIAAARGIGAVAPYFIDADATAVPGALPVGGLTVIRFRNSHLVYAVTWFCLAGLVAGATLYVVRDDRRRRVRAAQTAMEPT